MENIELKIGVKEIELVRNGAFFLVSSFLGFVAAVVCWFFWPAYVFLCMAGAYGGLIGAFVLLVKLYNRKIELLNHYRSKLGLDKAENATTE